MSESTEDPVALFEAGLAEVERGYRAAFEATTDEQSLREANAKIAGPSGALTRLMKMMPKLPTERRRDLGQAANRVKGLVQGAFDARVEALAQASRQAELTGPALDPTLPGRSVRRGRLHPLSRTIHELLDVFVSLGFEAWSAPEIDSTKHNFDMLGFPPDHPATDMQDSFFVSRDGAVQRDQVLRTHTTTVQVHAMTTREPPMAIVCPGAVYRRDDDPTHSPMFAQIDGFAVDEGLTFAHLKGVMTAFVQRLFGDDVPVRFRPSYFPFVEPGGEVDMGCVFCRHWDPSPETAARVAACGVCKGSGWMEILGCGMVHPVVFEAVGIDATKFTGFAFGVGIDRIAMLRHGVRNIRLLYENDVRFLSQL
jgi:phenylalanyl-tRNA synthetase alpha chain